MTKSNPVKKITITLNPKNVADAQILAAIEILRSDSTQIVKTLAGYAIAHMAATQNAIPRGLEIFEAAKSAKGKGFNIASLSSPLTQSKSETPIVQVQAPAAPQPIAPAQALQQEAPAPRPIQTGGSPVDDLTNF